MLGSQHFDGTITSHDSVQKRSIQENCTGRIRRMGIYLSTPKTDKTSDDGENEHCRYGVSAMQGWRSTMEDAHAAVLDLDKDMSFFGVYDGHGGKVVSRFCAKYLHYQVLKNKSYTKGDLSQSLQKAYLRMDDMMRGQRGWRELSVMNGEKNTKLNSLWEALSPSSSHKNLERKSSGAGIIEEDDDHWNSETGSHADFQGPTSGCTAVVALLQKDRVVVANAGDSRCVLSRRGKAFDLSRDHKPYLEQEKDRILQAGGFILAGRINGSLNLTRAIGDMEFKQNKYLPPEKQIVTAWPDTISVELTPADEFLILACDGIWDVLSSQEAVDFVHENMKGVTRVSSICEKLLERCLAPNTALGEGCDNMTAIIVMLKAALPLSQ